jgi:uncharacterized protein YdhG (YjbR/CyaY superfamily)
MTTTISGNSIDDYISGQPEAVRGVLAQVRNAIRKALPHAEEGISYRMPAYKLPEGTALYFAGWKSHYSLYPASERLVAAVRDELSQCEIEKGTIRFSYQAAVPVKLIGEIAKFRAKDIKKRKPSKH